MNDAAALSALSAMAHETRLAILRMLVRAGGPGLAAGVIAERAGVSASRLSFHLGILGQAGLVASRREGRHLFYRADCARLGGVVQFLLSDCCADHPEVRACCTPQVAGCGCQRKD